MIYHEDDYLQLSGLQHFAFCRRQWALIHIENQWADNFRTTDGELMHSNAHDAAFSESRGDTLIQRAVKIHSPTLGVSGECDVLEFHRTPDGITLPDRKGLWQPYPVEYTRGKPGTTEGDALQLCGQALCLEEMFATEISEGALYYAATRHRTVVPLTKELRRETVEALKEMHRLFERGSTPRAKYTRACKNCSMYELCQPELTKGMSASEYIRRALQEGDE